MDTLSVAPTTTTLSTPVAQTAKRHQRDNQPVNASTRQRISTNALMRLFQKLKHQNTFHSFCLQDGTISTVLFADQMPGASNGTQKITSTTFRHRRTPN
jgi:hypothetical protein